MSTFVSPGFRLREKVRTACILPGFLGGRR
jgi:hypothetical protein